MRSPRTLVALASGGALLAALAFAVWRTVELRRLTTTVRQAEEGNVALRRELREREARARGTAPRAAASAAGTTTAPVTDLAPAGRSSPALAGLRDWLAAHPEKSIPELSLVKESLWAEVATSIRPGSETDLRQAARTMRNHARQAFGERTADAIATFASTHNGQLPGDMLELGPYYDPPVGEEALRRHVVLARGAYASVPANLPLVGEIAGVDDDFDSVLILYRSSLTKVTADRAGAEIQRSIHRFLSANAGRIPGDIAALVPYMTVVIPENEAARYFINSDLNISGRPRSN